MLTRFDLPGSQELRGRHAALKSLKRKIQALTMTLQKAIEHVDSIESFGAECEEIGEERIDLWVRYLNDGARVKFYHQLKDKATKHSKSLFPTKDSAPDYLGDWLCTASASEIHEFLESLKAIAEFARLRRGLSPDDLKFFERASDELVSAEQFRTHLKAAKVSWSTFSSTQVDIDGISGTFQSLPDIFSTSNMYSSEPVSSKFIKPTATSACSSDDNVAANDHSSTPLQDVEFEELPRSKKKKRVIDDNEIDCEMLSNADVPISSLKKRREMDRFLDVEADSATAFGSSNSNAKSISRTPHVELSNGSGVKRNRDFVLRVLENNVPEQQLATRNRAFASIDYDPKSMSTAWNDTVTLSLDMIDTCMTHLRRIHPKRDWSGIKLRPGPCRVLITAIGKFGPKRKCSMCMNKIWWANITNVGCSTHQYHLDCGAVAFMLRAQYSFECIPCLE